MRQTDRDRAVALGNRDAQRRHVIASNDAALQRRADQYVQQKNAEDLAALRQYRLHLSEMHASLRNDQALPTDVKRLGLFLVEWRQTHIFGPVAASDHVRGALQLQEHVMTAGLDQLRGLGYLQYL